MEDKLLSNLNSFGRFLHQHRVLLPPRPRNQNVRCSKVKLQGWPPGRSSSPSPTLTTSSVPFANSTYISHPPPVGPLSYPVQFAVSLLLHLCLLSTPALRSSPPLLEATTFLKVSFKAGPHIHSNLSHIYPPDSNGGGDSGL
ncbi:hypothetical protein Agabi119p4_9963 [Agaricus bisporus var. burnettii]|uniref:Uncharacterized protein n=1 Tax=Agaricus bisporus var. burnettii TaxID=192524 RepID=A0A8H7C425_AGABI|nr:hypothetical protein Agabi119p4_9963 [Agaricus bisporus var. burnettii]